MSEPLFSRRVKFFGNFAMVILCVVFFLLPFSLRGARMAIDNMRNDVADWLPSDFEETVQLKWFREHFIGDQFVVVSWPGCTAQDSSYLRLIKRLKAESLEGTADLEGEELRAKEFGDKYHLHTTGDYHETRGNHREKWLMGEKGQWYFITQKGEVFRWEGQDNIVDAVRRGTNRFFQGENEAKGKYLDQFGKNFDENGIPIVNEFYQDPKKICARFFKSVTSGPEIHAQMVEAYEIGDFEPGEQNRVNAEIKAHQRLTGSVFGPTPHRDFKWTRQSLLKVIDEEKRKQLPDAWEVKFDQYVDFIIQTEIVPQQLFKLQQLPEVDQKELWSRLCESIGVKAPPYNSEFDWTWASFVRILQSELTSEESTEIAEDPQEHFNRFVRDQIDLRVNDIVDLLRNSPQDKQLEYWYGLWIHLKTDPPARQTCLIVTLNDTVLNEMDRAIGRPVLGKPRGRILELATGHCGINQENLHLGGPPVDNVAIDEEGSITLLRLVSLSAAIGITLAWLSFRSIRITLMLFFVGGVAAISSLAQVWWAGSTLDAILMTMPSLVYVLGISGAVHVVNYYRDACHEHGPDGAVETAVKHGWFPCTLAAFTTALGLISLCTSNLTPINKFGFFSAIATLGTVILLFTYLPAALQVWSPGYDKADGTGKRAGGPTGLSAMVQRFWIAVCNIVVRNHVKVTVLMIALLVFFAWGVTKIDTNVQLLKLFHPDAKILKDYGWMEKELGKLVPMEIVVSVDDKAVERREPRGDNQEGQTQQAVESQRLASDIKMSIFERAELSQRIRKHLDDTFGPNGLGIVDSGMSTDVFVPLHLAQGPTPQVPPWNLNLELESNRKKLLGLGYLVDDEKTGNELWRISIRLAALNDVDYAEFVNELKTVIEPIMSAYRYRTRLLNAIHDVHGDESNKKGRILFIGRDPAKIRPDFRRLQEELRESNPDETNATAFIDQTYIFSDTLQQLMVDRNFELMRNYDDLMYHRFFHPLDKDLRKDFYVGDNWKRALELHDVVVLVQDHEYLDMAFIEKHANKVLDFRNHHFEIDPDTKAPLDDQLTSLQRREKNDKDTLVSTTYTGIVPIVYKAQRSLLRSLQDSICLAFVMIAVVMMILLRNWTKPPSPTNLVNFRGGLVSMLPNVFPIILIFGAMGHFHFKVDIGSMMTAGVAMGVAVDDTIHFLNWYRIGLSKGLSRKASIRLAFDKVATAMTQTTMIAGLGLSAFAFSTFMPTMKFGILMLMLLAAALIGDLVFLPAILAGPLGKYIGEPQTRTDDPNIEGTVDPSTDDGPEGSEAATIAIESAHFKPPDKQDPPDSRPGDRKRASEK